jgi:hypothetical protein
MRNHSILNSFIWTGAIVCVITIVSALGAAVFALFCGALCWPFRVERVPVGFFWATSSGAIAGFLIGILWAIDRAVNWGYFLSASQDDSHRSATPCDDGKASLRSSLHELPKKVIDDTPPASGE